MRKTLVMSFLASVLLFVGSGSALAATQMATANFVDYTSPDVSGSNEPGAYFIDNSTFIGATFTLSSAADVTAIGGYFSEYSSGTIFGAIVNHSGNADTAGNWSNLSSAALASVVFTATGSDQSVSLSAPVSLAAGTYDVVFGTGLFGSDASSSSALVTYQDTIGNPSLWRSGDAGSSMSPLSSPDVRITATVAAVPEADTFAMMLAGLGLMGFVARRRQA